MNESTSKETKCTAKIEKPNRRLGNRKSKQGCLTCKARKVKCDETHPTCIRCQTSDRTCLGYGDVFVTVTQSARNTSADDRSLGHSRDGSRSQSSSPPLDFSSSPESVISTFSDSSEARALQYYQNEIAEILGGTIDSSFWTKSILELSESEPAIRQGLVALSSLWEARTRPDLPDRYTCQQRSIEQYHKALAITSQRVAQPDADTVALGTCVLFLCMHYLDDDKEQAAKLLKTGSGVLQTVLNKAFRYAESMPANTAATFLPIFERMLLLLRLFGIEIPTFRSRDTIFSLDYNFTHLDDARTILYWLLSESCDLIAKTAYTRTDSLEVQVTWDPEILQQWIHQQGLHLNAYAAWKIGFERLCRNTEHTIQNDTYISSLRITYTVAIIWTSSCFDREEYLAERFQDGYETVVREAGKVIAYNMAADKANIPFTFEMGLIPTLYLVALKCRDYETRHQALSLLGRAPEKEGLWRRDVAMVVVRRVIHIETNGLEVGADRVVFTGVKVYDSQIRFSDKQGAHVTFYARLDGSGDIWRVWEETVPLPDS